MNHTAFFKSIKNHQTVNCYVFEGEEEYIKESALAGLKQLLVPQGLEALNFTQLENPPIDELLAAAQTLPLMSEKRLVVVKNLGLLGGKGKKDEKQEELFLFLLENLPLTTCLVFYQQEKLDNRKKMVTTLKKVAETVSFLPLKEMELTKWIIQTFRGVQKDIPSFVAQELAFMVGNNTATLKEEIDKIASYMGEEGEVTKEMIKEIATPSLEYSVFDMVDSLVMGKEERTFYLQKKLIEEGGERIGILAMILRQYRILLFAKGMQGEKRDRETIRKGLGIPGFALEKALRQGRNYSLEELKQAVSLCVNTEFDIKRGALPQEGALEQLTFKLLRLKG